MAVKQPAAYSPGSSRVERGLFGQTSKACRGEGKNKAVREAGAGGVLSPTPTRLCPGGALGLGDAQPSWQGWGRGGDPATRGAARSRARSECPRTRR